MSIKQRPTLIASERGRNLIRQARINRSWIIEDERWLKEASKILEPEQNWDALPTGVYAANVSLATWKRFGEARVRIDANTFKAFCKVLGLNWENAVNLYRDLSEAPPLSNFYGRTQELTELQQWLVQERCRLVVIHGVGGIGKAALARQLVENIANQYDYIIWRSLNSTPSFQLILSELLQFLSNRQENSGNISQLMQSLSQHRCLLVLDDCEEIMGSNGENYSAYYELFRRVAKEAHQSSVLLISREKPQNLELLEGQLVRFRRLGTLNSEDAIAILMAEGISGREDELEEFSRRYSNPWVLKRMARTLQNLRGHDEASNFLREISVFVDDVMTNFLDEQFQKISQLEKNIIYWIAIRRNSASWTQLQIDTRNLFSLDEILQILRLLIDTRALVDKQHIEDRSIVYTLDLVILKYITNRFVEDNCAEIIQVIKSQKITNYELFISHSFITDNPEDEQLTQEQIRKIVKPICKKLLLELQSQKKLEEELKKILSLLEDRGLSEGYARSNIISLLS
ncbi:MAG: NB-ARC domain-containing protein [Rhizonema sp. PD37]|nr:NB-ARC domain-containing protein [Rhizonema sp. PD37]